MNDRTAGPISRSEFFSLGPWSDNGSVLKNLEISGALYNVKMAPEISGFFNTLPLF